MSDTDIIVPGSVDWLGKMCMASYGEVEGARKRLWQAKDETARLKRDLSAAVEREAFAQREYDATGKLLHEIWDQLRGELEHARPTGPEDE